MMSEYALYYRHPSSQRDEIAADDVKLSSLDQVILLVEDDKDLRELLFDFLEMEGYKVLQAANGEEGLRIAQVENPDLIISDVRMPVKNGLDFVAELKTSLDYPPPTVLITAFSDLNRDEARTVGAADVVTKPINLDTFVPLLAKVIEKHRSRPC